jgi:Fe-S-cluster containining protein
MDAASFRASYAENDATLRHNDDGACIFLGEAGCTVHSDRALVCRLFPLGREVETVCNFN